MTYDQWCAAMLSEDAEFKHIPFETKWEWFARSALNRLNMLRAKPGGRRRFIMKLSPSQKARVMLLVYLSIKKAVKK